MNNYLKNILYFTIGIILLLICLLVFLRHSQFENCIIVNQQNQWTLMMESKSYNKLADKKNLIIENNQIQIRLIVNNWIYNYDNKFWTVNVYDQNLISGEYNIFLDYVNLLW